MTLILKVQVDVSTPPPVAAEELCALAKRMGIVVTVDLCGIEMRARPDDSTAVVLHEYERDVRLSNYPTS